MTILNETFSYQLNMTFTLKSKIVTLCLFIVSALIGYKGSQYNTYYGAAAMVIVFISLGGLLKFFGKVKPKSA